MLRLASLWRTVVLALAVWLELAASLAGHTVTPLLALDTHAGPVSEPVWALYRRFLAHAGRMIPTSIEWDTEIPRWEVIDAEAVKARSHARLALDGGPDGMKLLQETARRSARWLRARSTPIVVFSSQPH